MWGLFSNHPLDDENVYDDDWIVHGSDQDYLPYYRPLNSLHDNTSMSGNCAHAGSGFGKNEMYPCFDESLTYGLAVRGLAINAPTLPLVLSTDGAVREPNTRSGAPATALKGTVTISGLIANRRYVIYRYDGTDALPTEPPFNRGHTITIHFVAAGPTHEWSDPKPFSSDSAVYYVCVPGEDAVASDLTNTNDAPAAVPSAVQILGDRLRSDWVEEGASDGPVKKRMQVDIPPSPPPSPPPPSPSAATAAATSADAVDAVSTAVAAIPSVLLSGGGRLPLVSLGTGSGQHADVATATGLWIRNGGRAIDTAHDYMDQGAVRKGIASSGVPASSLFLTTKISCGTYDKASRQIADNLRQLGVPTVNLTLIHFDYCDAGGSLESTWKALEDAKADGKTRAIGVSNFSPADLQKLKRQARVWPPAINQCSLSIGFHDDATIKYCDEQSIVYMGYSPLCGGVNGSSCTHGGVMSLPQVKAVAAAHSVSPAQVALKWIVQQGRPLATAVARADYIKEDLDLWSWGNLTDMEMKTLSAI